MLHASALTSMRAAMDASLPDTAAIQSYTPASDDQGGETRVYATTATVPCRLTRGRSDDESAISGKTTARLIFDLVVPTGTVLRPRDRAVVSGVTYEVEEIDSGGLETVGLTASVYRVT